jgi:hypothetical protein
MPPARHARSDRGAASAVRDDSFTEDASLLLKLPNELLLNIASHAEQSELHALTLSSRRLRLVAEQASNSLLKSVIQQY